MNLSTNRDHFKNPERFFELYTEVLNEWYLSITEKLKKHIDGLLNGTVKYEFEEPRKQLKVFCENTD